VAVISAPPFPIDPHKILGIEPGASPQEIRRAYRRRAKFYHPDAGGDEWMFRILNQAYEFLSTPSGALPFRPRFSARPASRAGGSRAPSVDVTTEPPVIEPDTRTETEIVRQGVKEIAFDRNLVVEVEKLWIRYPSADPRTLAAATPADRFLSCSLNIAWPDAALAPRASAIPDRDAILRRLVEVFEELRALSPIVASNDRVEDGRFLGWLGYAGVNQATVAFRQLRESLHARGFRLKPWTRDLIIPPDWRGTPSSACPATG
jgi:hypothetical protein